MERWVIDTDTLLRTLTENATALGIQDKVEKRAKEIQWEMRDSDEYIIPYVDAYEMAYNDILDIRY